MLKSEVWQGTPAVWGGASWEQGWEVGTGQKCWGCDWPIILKVNKALQRRSRHGRSGPTVTNDATCMLSCSTLPCQPDGGNIAAFVYEHEETKLAAISNHLDYPPE